MDQHVIEKQKKQKSDHDIHAKERVSSKGEKAFARNHGKGEKWLSGEILGSTGPLSFEVKLEDGRISRYHQDHLRKQL